MEMRRLSKVFADRWLVVLIGALMGLAGVVLFLALAQPTSESLFRATAPMRFDPAEGETIPDLADDIREAREFALIAAEELLAADPTSTIESELAEAKLLFITQGTSEAEAIDKAEALRQSYLVVDPEIGGSVDEALAELEDEALRLDSEIAGLQPTLTAEELTLIEAQTQLDQVITAIKARQVALILAEAGAATTEERDAIVAEGNQLATDLVDYQQQRLELGPTPVPELSSTDALLLDTLIARKELLNAEYERLFLRRLGVAGLGRAESISVETFASDPIDPVLLALAGLLGGGILATAGLYAVARTRRTVWLPEDIQVPVLGQIPARTNESQSILSWYDAVETDSRKTAVQALRSAVQAQTRGGGSTIALTGLNIPPEEVQALAADLAGSMAGAGDSVLLIDANFNSWSALGDYRPNATSLAQVLNMQPQAPGFNSLVAASVESAQVVRPGLSVIPSGPPPASPADALAGRQFRSLIAAAEDQFDITILVVDDIGTPSAQAAMQPLRIGLLVTAPGASTEPEVNGLIDDSERLRISIVGAVLVAKRRRLLAPFGRPGVEVSNERSSKSIPEDSGASPQSPMNRLHTYAIPDERRSALIEHSPLGDLAASFGVDDHGRADSVAGLGADLIVALETSSGAKAYEAVADYVVSRAEDMVTARYGYGDLLESLIEDVTHYKFLTLRPISGHRTVGSWLTEEIEREVDWQQGAEVVDQVGKILGGGVSNVGIDQWLDEEFLRRHLIRTDGEPEVWQFVSAKRAISVLVPVRRTDAESLEVLVTETVSKGVDEFERKRKAAITRADFEQASDFEMVIQEMRDFESDMKAVIRPTSKTNQKSRWTPDWSNGTRNSLAPFQARGLLPFDVLNDDELSTQSAIA